jgi:hypothetical protein
VAVRLEPTELLADPAGSGLDGALLHVEPLHQVSQRLAVLADLVG